MKKKGLIVVLAMLMALCVGAGATLAYLFVETNQVVNTFSPSNIDLTLVETTTDYKMIPGEDIAKDPKVTVTADVDCYVFVKVEKSDNYDTYLEDYAVATGWTQLQDGVYYRTVTATAAADGESFYVLAGNTASADGGVTVKDAVLKTDMTNLINGTDTKPTLTFTAYAIQQAGFTTPAAAWAELDS